MAKFRRQNGRRRLLDLVNGEALRDEELGVGGSFRGCVEAGAEHAVFGDIIFHELLPDETSAGVFSHQEHDA